LIGKDMVKQVDLQRIVRQGACVGVSDCGKKCFIAGKGSSGIALLAPVEPGSSATYYIKLEKASPKDSDQYIGGVSEGFAGSLDHFKGIKQTLAWAMKANGATFMHGERIYSEARGWSISEGDIIQLDVDMQVGQFAFTKKGMPPVIMASIPRARAAMPALVMYKSCWAITTQEEFESAPVQCVLQAPATPVSKGKGRDKGAGRQKSKQAGTPSSAVKDERAVGQFVYWRTYGKNGGKSSSNKGSPGFRMARAPKDKQVLTVCRGGNGGPVDLEQAAAELEDVLKQVLDAQARDAARGNSRSPGKKNRSKGNGSKGKGAEGAEGSTKGHGAVLLQFDLGLASGKDAALGTAASSCAIGEDLDGFAKLCQCVLKYAPLVEIKLTIIRLQANRLGDSGLACLVSRLAVCQLMQIYAITDCCLALAALGS
jgi:hypothetical protein